MKTKLISPTIALLTLLVLLPVSAQQETGDKITARPVLLVATVGAFEKNGLQQYDAILEINGMSPTRERFKEIGSWVKSGKEVTLLVLRMTHAGPRLIRLSTARDPELLSTLTGFLMVCQGTYGFGCSSIDLCQQSSQSYCLRTEGGGCADCVDSE